MDRERKDLNAMSLNLLLLKSALERYGIPLPMGSAHLQSKKIVEIGGEQGLRIEGSGTGNIIDLASKKKIENTPSTREQEK